MRCDERWKCDGCCTGAAGPFGSCYDRTTELGTNTVTPKKVAKKTKPASPFAGWAEWPLEKFVELFPDVETAEVETWPNFTGPMMKRGNVLRGYTALIATHRKPLINYTMACRRGDPNPANSSKKEAKEKQAAAAGGRQPRRRVGRPSIRRGPRGSTYL